MPEQSSNGAWKLQVGEETSPPDHIMFQSPESASQSWRESLDAPIYGIGNKSSRLHALRQEDTKSQSFASARGPDWCFYKLVP